MIQAFRVAQFFGVGLAFFGSRGFKEHARSFDPKALDVDLKGRHIIVTGATSGIGQATAQTLASHNATVHLICRDETRGKAVRDSIMSESTAADVRVHVCDISSLADVARLAEEFVHDDEGVHALINNAGVMQNELVNSKDGLESSFATNTLGTFAMTEMLRPALQRVPDARVVTVSSGGMLTERLEVEDLEGKKLRKNGTSMNGTAQYARCKRRQVALTEHWAREYPNSFWAASMHPGWVDTPGVRNAFVMFCFTFNCSFNLISIANSVQRQPMHLHFLLCNNR